MYAVIETGGKQYRVEVGTELEVELLDVEPGQTITLERVLLVVDGAAATVGQPVVDGAAVDAEVLGATRGDKVIAFKYRPKARRRVKKGHRQDLTMLRIADIRVDGKSAAATTSKTAAGKSDDRKAIEEAAARQAAEDAALAAQLKLGAPVDTAAVEEPAAAPKAAVEITEARAARAFEIFEDKAGKWRWRLRATNGELVAVSEQGFASKAGVIRGLDAVRKNVAESEGHHEVTIAEDGTETVSSKGFEVYEDKAGQWRWRLRAANGELLAVSEQGFKTKSGVARSLGSVRKNVAEAVDHEDVGATETPAPDAAPKRTRTKKDD
jgi:large subunit ribosomal protein L21